MCIQIRSSDSEVARVLPSPGLVVGVGPGTAVISIADLPISASMAVSNADPLRVLFLDVTVSTLRMKYDGPVPLSHTESSRIELDVLPGMYGFDMMQAPVVVSAILDDYSRTYITDTSSLTISSLNASIVTVDGDVLTAFNSGSGELINIHWKLCNEVNVSTTAELDVQLNLNRPEFTIEEGNVTVEESRERGSTIFSVTAVDLDTTYNAEVEYALLDSDFDGLFSVDIVSGDVIINDYLDAEKSRRYELIIEATDYNQRQFRESLRNDSTLPSHQHILNQPDTVTVSRCGHYHCVHIYMNVLMCTYMHVCLFTCLPVCLLDPM